MGTRRRRGRNSWGLGLVLLVLPLVGCAARENATRHGDSDGDTGAGAVSEGRDAVTGALRTRVDRDFTLIATAADLFRLERGRWPEALEELLVAPATDEGELPPYLLAPPGDPWTGLPYEFEPCEGGFRLISRGADGQPGGEGSAADIVKQFGTSVGGSVE
ncbi:MAG: type II secretion system protein GspG [Planctomycetota bacterium]